MLLQATANMKHKAMLVMLYSCGLRLSELLHLKITDIHSDRHLMAVRDAKGGKDRTTLPDDTTLQLLRKYYLMYRSICLNGRAEECIAVRVCNTYCSVA